MLNIEELIKYYPEGPNLEFKREEYLGDKRGELVKDILALANGNTPGDRYIVIGLTKRSNEDMTFFPVPQPEDSAHLHQYVLPKITPELKISYVPYQFEGNPLAVVIIHEPNDQPYMATQNIDGKKASILKKGEMWIRKGSTQLPVNRDDLDRIYRDKFAVKSLEGKISLLFANDKQQLQIKCIRDIKLPSDVNQKEIEDQIAYKEDLLSKDPQAYSRKYASGFTTNPTYATMDLNALRSRLESVKMNFAAQDAHYLYEVRAYQLNLNIYNSGEKHLEKVMLQLNVPVTDGLVIADHVYQNDYQQAYSVNVGSGYPKVINKEKTIVITQEVGEVRHRIYHPVFEKPLRIFADEHLSGKTVVINGTINAYNLTDPQHFELTVSFS